MEILIGRDLEAISTEAARLFISLSGKHIRASGRFVVALSGGTTPERLYQLLASNPYQKKICWTNVHIFFVDERFVPPDHPDSNFRLVYETLLKEISFPTENIHSITTLGFTLSVSAKTYEADIKDFFKIDATGIFPRFDLIILGIGEDGHTASLFPGSRMTNDTKHLVAAVRNRKIRHHRITLTLPVLNRARNIIFLVSGKHKAPIMEKVLMPGCEKIPASLVNPSDGKLHLFIDKEASKYILNVEEKLNAH
jgi:6-phosphogluconolactonase